MITKIKINNGFTFNKPVEINLKADMRTHIEAVVKNAEVLANRYRLGEI